MRGLSSILFLFRDEFNKFHNTGAQMLGPFHHMTGVTALWPLSKTHLSQFSAGSTQEDTSLFN